MMKKEEIAKQNKKQRPWVRRIFLIIIGTILGLNVYFANANGIVGNKLPMPFGYGVANVLSGSMEPTFSKGSLLIVKETKDVKQGDIIVYQSGSELIVHRVVDVKQDLITTRGDANNIADPQFEKTQIKGVVILWIPVLGSIINALKTPVGIIVILICAFLLVEGTFQKQKENDDAQLEAIKEEIRRLKEEVRKE